MLIWHQIPFVRLLLPFAIGIITGIGWGNPVRGLTFFLAGLLISYLVLISLSRWIKSYKTRWINGIFINLFLLLSGYQLVLENTNQLRNDDISHHAGTEKIMIRVSEPVVNKEKSFKVIARPIMAFDSVTWKKASGKLMLYFEKDSLASGLEYGDCLLISAPLQILQPPLNPSEFDYRRFLSNQGIYCQAFVRKGDWEVLDKNRGNPIKAIGIGLRKKFLSIFEEKGLTGKEYAVASAILLGYDENLDPDQKRQFAGAGAMHILCVSGLHVGIVYLVLSGLLGFMKKKRWLRITRTILLILSIWFYALITGFSPSVLRASTMFSFIIIGNSLNRKPNIYNSLAGSAFLLLTINPYMITAVGFQLSYLAVLGIVTLYKPFYSLMIPSNWLLDKIWAITAVSITATLATFPLSIFYFNQFPGLFLLTNLIAIPASTLILYLGILTLAFTPVSFLSGLFAHGLAIVIRVLNYSVGWIEGLPFSTMKGLYLSGFEVILVFLVCLSTVQLILLQKRNYIFIGAAGVLILMTSFTFRKINRLTQNQIIVYHIPKSSAIEFIKGNHELLLADSGLLGDERKIDYHLQSYRTKSGIRKPENIRMDKSYLSKEWIMKSGNFIRFGEKYITLIDSEFIPHPCGQKTTVDFLILTGNPNVTLTELCQVFDFGEIIFDSSNAYWMIEKWRKECEEKSIAYYAVPLSGARLIEL